MNLNANTNVNANANGPLYPRDTQVLDLYMHDDNRMFMYTVHRPTMQVKDFWEYRPEAGANGRTSRNVCVVSTEQGDVALVDADVFSKWDWNNELPQLQPQLLQRARAALLSQVAGGASCRRGRPLAQLTLVELQARARSRGIPGRSGMNKAELVAALRRRR